MSPEYIRNIVYNSEIKRLKKWPPHLDTREKRIKWAIDGMNDATKELDAMPEGAGYFIWCSMYYINERNLDIELAEICKEN